MSYSFVYTAAALLGLMTPMDQALMTMLENPALERSAVTLPDLPPLPLRPEGGRWRAERGPSPDSPSSSDTTSAEATDAAPRRRRPPRVQRAITGYTAHLASYLGETWAHRGWEELRARAPSLREMEPRFIQAEVPALGSVIRLTVGHHTSLSEAAGLCARLRAKLDYCAPLPLHEN